MDGLKIVIETLSQYNFLTNILPGTVLCIVLKCIVGYDLLQTSDLYLTGVICYFTGMVNNRFGSVVIEPLCKWTRLVRFAPYRDFLKAEKIDEKITILSMENNVFRSYISVFALTLLAYGYRLLADCVVFFNDIKECILLASLLILFCLSYRKQTKYVRERVEALQKD